METHKTKEQFIQDCKMRIANRNTLVKFYEEVYLPTLQKFDGKVYNKRFINALKTEAQNMDKMMSIYDGEYHIIISFQNYKFNYKDCESLYVGCKKVDDRINYQATIEDSTFNAWVDNFKLYTLEYQNAIDNYDDYMAVANAMEEAVKAYNSLPSPFKANCDKRYLSIH